MSLAVSFSPSLNLSNTITKSDAYGCIGFYEKLVDAVENVLQYNNAYNQERLPRRYADLHEFAY